MKELQELVDDMFWEYDRLSSSGQETLDKIAKLVGVPTNDKMKEIVSDG